MVVTVSVTPPTVSVIAPSDSRSLAGSVMFLRSTAVNPDISMRTVYRPGWTAEKTNAPVSLVGSVRRAPVCSSINVTVAPGIIWPL